MLLITEVQPSERREFVRAAAQFYRDLPAWVPPFEPDVLRLLDPRRNEYFRVPGNDAAFFLARRDGAIVGRIAAFHNAAHLQVHRDGVGFFGFFECENDPATARALLDRAAAWLRARGLTTMRGPANFNVQEEAGVLVDGFEHQPMAGMAYTPPYYLNLLGAAGLARSRDLLVYRLDEKSAQYDRVARIVAAAERAQGLVVRNLDMSRIPEEAKKFEVIFAEAWRDNWGMVPISAEEFAEAYQRYRFFLLPEMVYLAEVNGEPAAAFVTMPDMNVLIKETGGRLWPFGWWTLLTGRKRITRFRTFMMGVRPQFRRLGLPLIFLSRCREELLKRGATLLEFSWILEDNHETRAIIERIGGWRAQTLRLFEEKL